MKHTITKSVVCDIISDTYKVTVYLSLILSRLWQIFFSLLFKAFHFALCCTTKTTEFKTFKDCLFLCYNKPVFII